MTLKQMTINRKRLQDKIEALNKIGKLGETGVRRLALSKEYREGIDLVKTWMDEIGLKTRVDHFGNLFGRLEGKDPNAPVVMIGSHIDSQPNGGRFDGTIGVLGALETVQTMIESNHTPEVPIEIVAFCDEEGFRFNTGVFGSRGITGKWTEDDLKRSDQDGMSRRDALIEFGADPNRLKESEYAKGSIASFIEMHIEQGPVLEAKNLPVGIVTGIAGPLWLTVELTGFAGHAGTVPMALRQDALVGTAKIITALNDIVKQEDDAPTVGTVGNIEVEPGARAVIPEKVTFTIDLRDTDINRRNRYEHELRDVIDRVARENGLSYQITEDSNILPENCSKDIIQLMRDESTAMGLTHVPELMSGAFHDALIMASVCDIGMIFVQSKDGISHNPKEFSSYDDIAMGTELLYRTTLKLSRAK